MVVTCLYMLQCRIKGREKEHCSQVNMSVTNAGYTILKKLSSASVFEEGNAFNNSNPSVLKDTMSNNGCKHNVCVFTGKLHRAHLTEQMQSLLWL